MFRRKDELDMEAETADMQGSLLNDDNDNTVSVLSPEKAAEYQQKQQTQTSSKSQTAQPIKPASSGSNFGATSAFGQTARAVQSSATAKPTPLSAPSASNTPSAPANSSDFRPANTDSGRFRPPSEVREPSKPVAIPTTPSNFNQESKPMLNNPSNPNERVLTVGNDILLKGEITTCDRLVIEGKVNATVSEVHTMELAAAGSFNGTAEVEYAEISGVFEGNLKVRTSLVIHQTGKVSGNIAYGEIEIARGGSLTGEIQTIGDSVSTKKSKEKAAA